MKVSKEIYNKNAIDCALLQMISRIQLTLQNQANKTGLMSGSPKKVTIHDIARELGLTGSTVSRALKDHPRISQATKKLVRAKADELNYRPNTIASTLRTGRSNSLGLIVPRINRNFFANLIHGVEQVCTDSGYHLLICQSQETLAKEKEAISTLRNSRVDGILLSLSVETSQTAHLQNLVDSGIPTILVDRANTKIPLTSVTNDDYEVSKLLTQHLIEQGYKHLVHYGGPQFLDSYKNRYQGFLDALTEAGLSPSYPLSSILTIEQGYEKTMSLFNGTEIPDAIVSASDYSAQGAMKALKELGRSVPGDVAVAGYANETFTELLQPQLTSVELFPEEIGKRAALLLISQIEGGNSSATLVSEKIIPKIFHRASTMRV